MNKLILGDCLEVLQKLEPESIDLIYIDPPFFSNKTYEIVWGDKGEMRSFEDRFSGGIDHYIAWLADRVREMYKLLKPTGSIFLHCDWHANAYIRVIILDKIFGANNLRSEITWQRQTAKKGSQFEKKSFGHSSDTIFWYSKSNQYTFHIPKMILDEETMLKKFSKIDVDGRKFRLDRITLPRIMMRKNLIYEYKGFTPEYGWMMNKEKLEIMDSENRLFWNGQNKPYRKYFADEYFGQEVSNVWNDIFVVSGKEAIHYPTQKPVKLLDRIISCASNEGDTILDCFMGGGTTVAVADKLNRNWIGIDQSVQAVKVTEFRLNVQQDLFSKPFTLQLHKYDYDTLRNKDAFEFESLVITQFGGVPQNKKGGDKGIDGYIKNSQTGLTPIQAKRSDDIGVNVVKNFYVSAKQYDKNSFESNKAAGKPIGYIIAFSFGKGAIQEVGRLKNDENVIIKLLRVDEILPIAKKPNLTITINDLGIKGTLREMEFIATAESETGIEFYSWDFEFNETQFLPQILRDKEGKQSYQFKAGEHKIAVKVVDGEGLESIEIVKLKVNGKVERK